jgi:hypothetical protein
METRQCPECEKWFEPTPGKKGRQITCSPECGHDRRRRAAREWDEEHREWIKERTKKLKAKRYIKDEDGGFICPYCRKNHNTPTDLDGHKWQYCYPCRENFELNQMPPDEWAESHRVYSWEGIGKNEVQ